MPFAIRSARDRKRRREAGVPNDVRFRTRHELALEMLKAHGDDLPHAWVGGDTEMGRENRSRGVRPAALPAHPGIPAARV